MDPSGPGAFLLSIKKTNPEGNWSSAIGTPPSDYENIVKNQDIIRIK